ncbi:unnamed protein product [Fraxinus pennsylvanica]|uniref:Uncharacterized protein n=1 Tax=Fraxinus pennsylvanica TaxID=56036 RepID=A0AAD1ZSR0_9LAMI|nr:unnamed protein product [Fraxinus pennsylvanica]
MHNAELLIAMHSCIEESHCATLRKAVAAFSIPCLNTGGAFSQDMVCFRKNERGCATLPFTASDATVHSFYVNTSVSCCKCCLAMIFQWQSSDDGKNRERREKGLSAPIGCPSCEILGEEEEREKMVGFGLNLSVTHLRIYDTDKLTRKFLPFSVDISFDSDIAGVREFDGPSLSSKTHEHTVSMYLDMDKFNSTSSTSTLQVDKSSNSSTARSAIPMLPFN